VAEKIKIVPDDFKLAAAELHRIKDLLDVCKAELISKYTLMREEWQGLAGEAFEIRAHKLLKSFEHNIAHLSQLTADIEQAGKYLEEADRQLAQAVTAN